MAKHQPIRFSTGALTGEGWSLHGRAGMSGQTLTALSMLFFFSGTIILEDLPALAVLEGIEKGPTAAVTPIAPVP